MNQVQQDEMLMEIRDLLIEHTTDYKNTVEDLKGLQLEIYGELNKPGLKTRMQEQEWHTSRCKDTWNSWKAISSAALGGGIVAFFRYMLDQMGRGH